MNRRAKRAKQALLLMDGAQIRALQEHFEREREAWHAARPALEREAARLGKRLVMLSQSSALLPDGFAPVVFEQTLSYRFERIPITPKALRRTCGARTRNGGSCQCRALDGKTRCALHGGKSTGPKTEAGRAAIAAANRARAKIEKIEF